RAQGIEDGAAQNGQSGCQAGLAHAFDAQWTYTRGRGMPELPDLRYEPRARHVVVEEASREKLAARSVVHRVLAENLPGSLHDGSVQLAFDDRVIHDDAEVIDGDVRDNRRAPRVRIDFDLGDVAARGKGRAERALTHERQRFVARERAPVDAHLRLAAAKLAGRVADLRRLH